MGACERCWSDARRVEMFGGDMVEEYRRLLRERTGPNACTPEQQAGEDATPCEQCGGRLVRHQYTGECMVDPAHNAERSSTDHRPRNGKGE